MLFYTEITYVSGIGLVLSLTYAGLATEILGPLVRNLAGPLHNLRPNLNSYNTRNIRTLEHFPILNII